MTLADSRLLKEKQFHVTTAPGWLGSVLVHLVVVVVVLYAGYFPVKKSEIIWVSPSSTVLQLPELNAVSQQEKIEPEHLAIKDKDPVPPPLSEVKADVVDTPKKTENQAIAQNITIEPKVTQVKPPPPLKIRQAGKVKQKISKPTESTNVTPEANQMPRVTPIADSEIIVTENPLPVKTKEIATVAEAKYLQANFTGIRNKVKDNLRYPAMARRQGWQGQVQVRFIILLSGEIEDLQILSSSGYSLLDRQALQAIKVAAPFPVPPVVASITVPVSFELN